MKMYTALLVIVLLGMGGCAGSKPPFYWFHPDKTLEEAKADYAECESQAQEEAEEITQDEYFERLRSPVVLSGDEAKKETAQVRRSLVFGPGRVAGSLQAERLLRLHDQSRLCAASRAPGFGEYQDQRAPLGRHRGQTRVIFGQQDSRRDVATVRQ
jgi:hypothetical protein